MELNKYKLENDEPATGMEKDETLIQVRAVISCPTCDYEKRFRNKFHRHELEMLTVALKVFDWLVCNDCGELLDLNLNFEI